MFEEMQISAEDSYLANSVLCQVNPDSRAVGVTTESYGQVILNSVRWFRNATSTR